jgi:hypothetical protein
MCYVTKYMADRYAAGPSWVGHEPLASERTRKKDGTQWRHDKGIPQDAYYKDLNLQ